MHAHAEGQENSSSAAQSGQENVYTGRCGTVPVLDDLELLLLQRSRTRHCKGELPGVMKIVKD